MAWVFLSDNRGGRLVVISTIATIVAAAPLVVASPTPLLDWPNHIAGVAILTSLLRGDAFWSQYYEVNHALVPNSALDFGMSLLNYCGVPLGLAAQLFLVLLFCPSLFSSAEALRWPGPWRPPIR